jgi:hypothetical protein
MAMFVQLQQGDFPLYELNFGVITLFPKKKMQFKFSNIGQFVYFTLVLRFSQRWVQIESRR